MADFVRHHDRQGKITELLLHRGNQLFVVPGHQVRRWAVERVPGDVRVSANPRTGRKFGARRVGVVTARDRLPVLPVEFREYGRPVVSEIGQGQGYDPVG